MAICTHYVLSSFSEVRQPLMFAIFLYRLTKENDLTYSSPVRANFKAVAAHTAQRKTFAPHCIAVAFFLFYLLTAAVLP
jgi:hypothetical protein